MQGSSSTKGRLPPTITPQMILYLWEQPQAVTCQTPSSVHSPGQSRVWQRHITTFGGVRDTARTNGETIGAGTPHIIRRNQDKCCTNKCPHDNRQPLQMIPQIHPQSSARIWPVKAEIFGPKKIWNIWFNAQTRVGTPHKTLRCLRSIGGGTVHFMFLYVLEAEGGHRTFSN